MFIANHFWKILFMVILTVAGYFYWQEQKNDKSQNMQVLEFARLISPKLHTEHTSIKTFQSDLFQAMALLHRHRSGNGKITAPSKQTERLQSLIHDANFHNGCKSVRSQLIYRQLKENLKRCEEYGLFEENSAALDMMATGRSPKVAKGAFKGEKLVVAFNVSPVLAREGRNAISNATIVPESIRALSDEVVTSKIYSTTQALERAEVIERASWERIQTLYRRSESAARR